MKLAAGRPARGSKFHPTSCFGKFDWCDDLIWNSRTGLRVEFFVRIKDMNITKEIITKLIFLLSTSKDHLPNLTFNLYQKKIVPKKTSHNPNQRRNRRNYLISSQFSLVFVCRYVNRVTTRQPGATGTWPKWPTFQANCNHRQRTSLSREQRKKNRQTPTQSNSKLPPNRISLTPSPTFSPILQHVAALKPGIRRKTMKSDDGVHGGVGIRQRGNKNSLDWERRVLSARVRGDSFKITPIVIFLRENQSACNPLV